MTIMTVPMSTEDYFSKVGGQIGQTRKAVMVFILKILAVE